MELLLGTAVPFFSEICPAGQDSCSLPRPQRKRVVISEDLCEAAARVKAQTFVFCKHRAGYLTQKRHTVPDERFFLQGTSPPSILK